MGKFVADIIADIGLLLSFGEGKAEIREKCEFYLLSVVETKEVLK